MAFSLTINIDEIPEPGLTLEGELAESWVAESLLEAYTPTSAVSVALLVRRFQANVYVEGVLRASTSFLCSRTLERGRRAIDVNVSELFQPSTTHTVNLGEGVDTEALDDEMRTYEGNTIDIEPVLRELVVLAQEPYPTVEGANAPDDPDRPIWQSSPEDVDPRWAALKNLKLN